MPHVIPPLYPEVSYGLAPRLPDNTLFFGSGRQALKFLTLRLLERQESLLFVLPAYTCETVVQAISEAGGDVSFVDVGDDLDLDLDDVRRVVQAHPLRRLVLLPTSLFGAPLRNHKALFPDAWVIEDRCQAIADPASQADYQILSFGKGKLVSGMGGGALVGQVSAFSAAYAALPSLAGTVSSVVGSVVMEQLVLRRGWRWLHTWLDKSAGPLPDELSAEPIDIHALSAQRARWITHSMQRADLASRVRLADQFANGIPETLRFNIPKGLPYLRYPVKGDWKLPGASSGRMYALTWRMAERQRGVPMPGAARLVGCSMLPTHALVTPRHVRHYGDVLSNAMAVGQA